MMFKSKFIPIEIVKAIIQPRGSVKTDNNKDTAEEIISYHSDSNKSYRQSLRRQIASSYLNGNGIEIGALHSPLEVPSNVNVKYLDRMKVVDLRQQYRELENHDLVNVDIIDDGEKLQTIKNDSVDFIIANHMIEHCQDPLGTIKNYLRVLRPNGVIYMAVPDKRHTFDKERPITSLEHVIRDYKEGPQWSMKSHFEEWNRLVNKVTEQQIDTATQHLINIDYSIHFHVWRPSDFMELLSYCINHLSFPMEIELLQKNEEEFIAILRKT